MKNLKKFILVFFAAQFAYHSNALASGDGGFNGGVTPWFYQCTHENLTANTTVMYAIVMNSDDQCPPFDSAQSNVEVAENNKARIISKSQPVPIAHLKTTGSAHDCQFGILPDLGL